MDWQSLYQLQHRKRRRTAARNIVMFFPVFRVEGNIGQHINGSLEYIEAPIFSDMMKTVSWIATFDIDAERFTIAIGATFMCMARYAFSVNANEDGIVILSVFKKKFGLCKVCNDITIKISVFYEIRERSTHISIGSRKDKRFRGNIFLRRSNWVSVACTIVQEHKHGILITQAIMLLNKTDRMSTLARGMIEPFIAPNGHAVITGQPFFSTGGHKPFPSVAEELFQVHTGGAFFLLI